MDTIYMYLYISDEKNKINVATPILESHAEILDV